jgi:hypothetical protein
MLFRHGLHDFFGGGVPLMNQRFRYRPFLLGSQLLGFRQLFGTYHTLA